MVIVDRAGQPRATLMSRSAPSADCDGEGLQEAKVHGNGELWVIDGKGRRRSLHVDPKGDLAEHRVAVPR